LYFWNKNSLKKSDGVGEPWIRGGGLCYVVKRTEKGGEEEGEGEGEGEGCCTFKA